MKSNFINFTDLESVDFQSADLQHFSTNDKFLDQISGGGYYPGSLWIFAGAPKVGKSRLLQNLAAASSQAGIDTAFVSLEMSAKMIVQRIESNLFDIKMTELSNKDFDKKYKSVIDDYFDKHKDSGKLIISDFPAASLTVSELEKVLLEQEKIISEKIGTEFHFKIIFVDYLNILAKAVNNYSVEIYTIIKQIVCDLKGMAQRNGWCVITSAQLKPAYSNTENVNMQAVAESNAISEVADLVFAIIQTKRMREEHEQYIKILLNRIEIYQNIRQKYLIDDPYMRLTKSNDTILFDGIVDDNDIKKTRKSKYYVSKYMPASDKAAKGNVLFNMLHLDDNDDNKQLFPALPDDIQY